MPRWFGRALRSLLTVALLGCSPAPSLTPLAPAPSVSPDVSASPEVSLAPESLIPTEVPDSARALMAETIIAAEVPSIGKTLVGAVGDRGVLVDIVGSVRSDWSQPVVVMPGVARDWFVAIDARGRPAQFGSIPIAGETLTATRNPAGDRVFVFGASFGLIVMTKDGEITRLIEGGDPPEFERQAFGPGLVEWSASGETLGVSTCSEETCVAWFVRVADGSNIRVDGFVPLAVGDDVVLGYASKTDRAWLALRLDTLERTAIGSPDGVAYDGYFVDATTAVISGADPSPELLSIHVVDVATGDDRLVLDVSDGRLLTQLWRSDRWAVLASPFTSSLLEAADHGGAYWDLLDLESGEVLARSVPVGFRN